MATGRSLQEQVQFLTERVQEQHSLIQALQQSARASGRPKLLLPDPTKFDGKLYYFDTWLPSIQAKILVDGENRAIGNATAIFYYVYDRLEPQVQAQVLP